ncbi:hypothetical protein [Blastococcus saxobsidens]|uniref:Acyl-CoA thioesterase-like C-terminal domain-containing protein n=1 Tax=Blastococcus saxobsidens TaxID=138336 RepID=A0A4Q7YCJ2_9ACTN|nr:hypothetical protein [Blastococcus saxobsidens]RZU33929.1 hypothetical protein BKA19_3670 [Blastococcus saxobsidens]
MRRCSGRAGARAADLVEDVDAVELTAHLARPAPGPGAWVRVDQRTVWCDADVAIDDVELRAEDGALVARGRQTRRLVGP